MNKKNLILSFTIIFFFIIILSFSIYFYIITNVFKTPIEIKYDIKYIQVENNKIWSMENQQKDYDSKKYERIIYFFMTDHFIKNEELIFEKLNKNFYFPKNEQYCIYVYKESKKLPKYWTPEYNNFMLDIIDMHESDLYLILECNNNSFKTIKKKY